jgi:hypothetical protein
LYFSLLVIAIFTNVTLQIIQKKGSLASSPALFWVGEREPGNECTCMHMCELLSTKHGEPVFRAKRLFEGIKINV